jgi:hypothetical protein
MQSKTKASMMIISILCVSLMLSCGRDSSSDGVTFNDNSNLNSGDLFYATMQDATPVYEPIEVEEEALRLAGFVVPVQPLIQTEEWSSAELLYSVYFTLRDFQSPRDEGIVDRSNFYKLLFDAETVLSYAYSYAEALPASQTIAAPFAGIDTSATVFTNAANVEDDSQSIAYSNTDETLEALVTWKWLEDANPNKAERGIAYYVYNRVTNDISIDMVFSVDYDISSPETEYNLRCKATGNSADHSFQFNYLINSTRIIAKGVSQGQDNYVIFKYSTGGDTYYLRVPAGEGEAYFQDICENHPEEVLTDPDMLQDDQNYLAWIEGEPFMDEDDLLTSTEQLNIGVEGRAGTINLDF